MHFSLFRISQVYLKIFVCHFIPAHLLLQTNTTVTKNSYSGSNLKSIGGKETNLIGNNPYENILI